MIQLSSDFINKDTNILVAKSSNFTPNTLLLDDATIKNICVDNYDKIQVLGTLNVILYGERKLYNIKLKSDLSNLIALYDYENNLCKIGILDDDIYLPIYRKYSLNDINDEIITLIIQCSKYFIDNIISDTIGKTVYCIGLECYENYALLDLNVVYGTEKDKKDLEKLNINSSNINNFPNAIPLSHYLKEKFITFLISIKKDNLANPYEIFTLIIEKIFFNLKNTNWNSLITTSTNFSILGFNIYK